MSSAVCGKAEKNVFEREPQILRYSKFGEFLAI